MLFTIIGGDGREYGPVTAEQVRAWMAAGRADEDSKVKVAGTEEWKTVADFPEFSGDEPGPGFAGPAPFEEQGPPLAGRGARLGATLVDMLVGFICVLPGGLMLGSDMLLRLLKGEWPDDFDVGRVAGGFALLGLGLFLVFIVQTWLLTTRGQTVGKRLVGIRIVRYRDGSPAGFVHGVLLRSWVINLIGVIPTVGTYFPFLDLGFIFGPERRCLHDLIADTKVVVAARPKA
jgi:uncharacterized RDD family membrane protein YckC